MVRQGNRLLSPMTAGTDDSGMRSTSPTQEARTMSAARRFQVTAEVLYNGSDSHGSITEVVEAESANEAEMKVVAEAREVLPSNASVRPLVTIEIAGPAVHVFNDMSSGEVYDETQTSDLIRDGDVLVVPSEQRVAILVEAWPVAYVGGPGEFHELDTDGSGVKWETLDGGKYADSAKRASEAAAEHLIHVTEQQ